MAVHLYLSLTPEALIASMLSPTEFGVYYAVGTQKKAHGQAMFFELDPEFRSEFFDLDEGIKRCVPHEDGTLKRSIYVSVYRVLERVPLSALEKLFLVTQDGRTLGLDASDLLAKDEAGLHLYQEIAPVHPLVVSTSGPRAFFASIVQAPTSLISLPSTCFVELRLGELAQNPEGGAVRDLPYQNMDHLRQCLVDIRTKTIQTKMVDRVSPAAFPYRMAKNGAFVGNVKEGLLYFPLPAPEELRASHYSWWRSANM